jgi:fructose-bisphosphate aldolase class II
MICCLFDKLKENMKLPALVILQVVRKNGLGIGAFNFVNMEMARAIVDAANETQKPVILQASMGGIDYAGLSNIIYLAKAAKEMADVPITLHLDHGNFDYAEVCIQAGFDSVMFDGSMLSMEENIEKTKKLVKLAHKKKVMVEAEVGRVGGVEEHLDVSEAEASYTKLEDAVNFVKKTGCDSLAIAIGTAHGVYSSAPQLQFELIGEIARALPKTPLVMHGSSGVALSDVQAAIKAGITKINIDTDLRQAFSKELRAALAAKPEEYDLRKYLKPAREAVKKVVAGKILAFSLMELGEEAAAPPEVNGEEKTAV